MLFIFSTPVFIRHLCQLKTVVILHRCLIRALPLAKFSAIMPDIITCNRAVMTCDCTCLGYIWQCDKNRNDPICVMPLKVAKAT